MSFRCGLRCGATSRHVVVSTIVTGLRTILPIPPTALCTACCTHTFLLLTKNVVTDRILDKGKTKRMGGGVKEEREEGRVLPGVRVHEMRSYRRCRGKTRVLP